MAAASRSTKYATLGVADGPETSVLVDAMNLDVDSNIEFAVLARTDGVELSIISATAKTGTPSVVFNLQGWDEASQTWETLVTSTALTDAGSTWLLVSHHAAAVTNHSVGRLVRPRMRLNMDYTGTPVTDVLNGVTVTAHAI